MRSVARGRLANHISPEFGELLFRGVLVVSNAVESPDVYRDEILERIESIGGGSALLQTRNAGQWDVSWRLRAKTEPMWRRLYDTDHVMNSFDGLSVVRSEDAERSASQHTPYGEPTWMHRDQRRSNENLADTIQGYVALTDAREDDYSTVFYVPKVHADAQAMLDAYHARFHRRVSRAGRAIKGVYDEDDGNYHEFDEDELQWWRTNAQFYKPILKRGDMLLWCSPIPHAATAFHIAAPLNVRVGAFVSMVPASLVDDATRRRRRQLMKTGLTSSHNVFEPTVFPCSQTKRSASVQIDVQAIQKRLVG
jgi:hypothetical protein